MTTKAVLVCDQCQHTANDPGVLPPGWLSLVHVDPTGTPHQLHFEDWHCMEEFAADQRIEEFKAKQVAEMQSNINRAHAAEALHREWDEMEERRMSIRGQLVEMGEIDPLTGEHQAKQAEG